MAVSGAAANCLREGDILVRSGGEEFLVVIPGANSADAERIAERIRRSIEVMAVETTEGLVSVTVSLGAVSTPEVDVLDTQEMIALVDKALYASKGSGRNKTTVMTSHKISSAEANSRKGSLAGLS